MNKKDITEIRSFARPPQLVEKVLEAVMILRQAEPTWAEAKRQLSKDGVGSGEGTTLPEPSLVFNRWA